MGHDSGAGSGRHTWATSARLPSGDKARAVSGLTGPLPPRLEGTAQQSRGELGKDRNARLLV